VLGLRVAPFEARGRNLQASLRARSARWTPPARPMPPMPITRIWFVGGQKQLIETTPFGRGCFCACKPLLVRLLRLEQDKQRHWFGPNLQSE